MAEWQGCFFHEVNVARVPHGALDTNPSVRLHVSGGETVDTVPALTVVEVDAIVSTDQLTALESALVRGDYGDLSLQYETIPSCQLVEIGDPLNVYNFDTWEVALSFEEVTEIVTPLLGVNLNGASIPGVLSVSTAVGRRTKFAKATVNCDAPQGSRGDVVEIYGDTGAGAIALFKGKVKRGSGDFFPGQWTLECGGTAEQLQRQWWRLEEYTGQTAAAMVTNLIEKRGGLHHVENSGWVLGQKMDVIVRPGDTFISWIDKLSEVDRKVLYDRHDGAVYWMPNDPTATSGLASCGTFTEGENILSYRVHEDPDAVRNMVLVEGMSFEGTAIRAGAFAANAELDALSPESAPNYNTVTVSSDLIEIQEHATGIAAQHLAHLNIVPRWVEFTTPFNPYLVPDGEITLVLPTHGINAQVLIDDVKHDIGGEGGETHVTTNTGGLGAVL